MTKAEAIQTLLKCDWLEQACKNIGKEDWEELRQRFWLSILEQREDIFENIRDLRFYSVRMIINQNSTMVGKESKRNTVSEIIPHNGPASEIYGNWGESRLYLDMAKIISEENISDIEGLVLDKDNLLGRLPMYDRVIFKLHERGVSCRKISEFTHINRNEINSTVNRVKQFIKRNVQYRSN